MRFQSHITFQGALTTGLELPLVRDAENRSSFVDVDDATSLAVGQDVSVGWTITPEFVEDHGMTDIWEAFNGTWRPFFRREIVAIDTSVTPHRVELDVPLRYPALMRDQAQLRVESGYLEEVGVVGLGLANAVGYEEAWAQDQVHVLELTGVKDAWVQDIAFFPSPVSPTEGPGASAHLQSSGLLVRDAKRVTVSDSELARPQHRGGGGNGYLFEVRSSNEVLFRDLVGRAGRWLVVDQPHAHVHGRGTYGYGNRGLERPRERHGALLSVGTRLCDRNRS